MNHRSADFMVTISGSFGILVHDNPGELDTQFKATQALLQRGDSINQMMQVTGGESVTLQNLATWQKSMFIDIVYLQQDSFESVDAAVPIEWKKESFGRLQRIINRDFQYRDKEQVRIVTTRLTGLCKNLNYAASDSDYYVSLIRQID